MMQCDSVQSTRGRPLHSHAAMLNLLFVGCAHIGGGPVAGVIRSTGLDFPMIFQAGCRDESCQPGIWAACDSLHIVEAPLQPQRVIALLTPNDRFEVQGANTVVQVPGVIRVKRATHQGVSGEEEFFEAGDTLYVLDYRSEGFFNVWYQGGLVRLRAFWPWKGQPGEPGELAEVLREPESQLWLRVEIEGGVRGWVQKDSDRMLNPIALSRVGRENTPCVTMKDGMVIFLLTGRSSSGIPRLSRSPSIYANIS